MKQQVDTYNIYWHQSPLSWCLLHFHSLWPPRNLQVFHQEGQTILDAMTSCLVPNIMTSFGIDIAQVLALPLLCTTYKGELSRNHYTFPIIPLSFSADLKSMWVEDGFPPIIIHWKNWIGCSATWRSALHCSPLLLRLQTWQKWWWGWCGWCWR